MIIDTHCHYNIEPLWDDNAPNAWQTHWHAAQKVGVLGTIVVGVNAKTSSDAISIAATDTHLKAAIGFHPTDDLPEGQLITEEYTATTLADIELKIRSLHTAPDVIAIGEVGLDYYRLPQDSSQAELVISHQKATCELQLHLAAELQLPLMLHVRDVSSNGRAYSDIIQLLKSTAPLDQPFILHCVSGAVAYVQDAIAMGAYIGVAGNVTYKSAESIRELVRSVPQERVLLETDAPFLAPQTHRGKACEPWMIADTAAYLEQNLGISQQRLLENAYTIFPQFAEAASQSLA